MKKDIFKPAVFFIFAVLPFFSCAGNGKKDDIEIPASKQFEVLFSSSGNGEFFAKAGGKEIDSGTMVNQGSLVVFTAVPSEKFSVGIWTKNGIEETSLKGKTKGSFKADSDLNVSVVFKKNSKRVSFSANAGGELTAEINGNSITSGELQEIESEVLFQAVPKEGYKIAGWEVNKKKLEDGENKTAHTMQITDNISVHVTFEKLKFPVYFSAEGGGTVNAAISSGNIQNGDSVDFNRKVTFTAVPDDKKAVDSWLLNGKVFSEAGKKKKISLNVKGETTIAVIFK